MPDLSENLNEWPTNPREVLGVANDATSKDVRRAYFRLIRRFTPDDFPSHFQRIRECYEWVESGWGQTQEDYHDRLENRNRDSIDDDEEAEINLDDDFHADDDIGSAADSSLSSHTSFASGDSPFREARRNRSNNPLDEIWKWIDQGDFETARLRLETLNETDRSSFSSNLDERKFLLYFLKRFNTADQSDEAVLSRLQLLIDILSSSDSRIAAELRLREEAFWNPRPFATSQFQSLISDSTHPNTLDFLYRLRWECLGKNGYKTILSDVKHLNTLAFHLGENRLMGLIQESLEYSIWVNSNEADQHYRESYDLACSNAGVGGTDYDVADAIEFLWEAAKQWKELWGRKLGFIGQLAVKMIPFSRTDGHLAKMERWREAFSSVPINRKETLIKLDELIHLYPLAMSVFELGVTSMADLFIDEDETTLPFDDAENLISAFFSSIDGWNYDRMRAEILQFCCENSISIDQFGYVADSTVMDLNRDQVGWSEMIERDSALRCAFWISMVNY